MIICSTVVKIKICKGTDILKKGAVFSCDGNLIKIATLELWEKLMAKSISAGGNFFVLINHILDLKDDLELLSDEKEEEDQEQKK
jgi:hypothetical protein